MATRGIDTIGALTDPRPGDAGYLSALAPTPTPALLPTGDDPLDPYYSRRRIADLERQLAVYEKDRKEIKETLGLAAGGVGLTLAQEIAKQLAEAKKRDANAETVRLATLERYEAKDKENSAEINREREARLRAEAGAALVRLAAEALLKARQGCHSCNPVGALDHPIAELRVAVSSTDIGARLAVVLEEITKERGNSAATIGEWERRVIDAALRYAMEGKP